MALLWTEGFDRYTTTANVVSNSSFWSSQTTAGGGSGYLASGGISGGGAFAVLQVAGGRLDKTNLTGVLTAGNGAHASFWWKTSGGTMNICDFNTNIAGSSAAIRYNGDGTITALRHGDNAVLATSAVVISNATYYNVEYAAKWNTAINGGYVKIWINGNLIINFSGATVSGTAPTTFTGISFLTSTSGQVNTYDDVIVWDETGTDFVYTQLSTTYLPTIETKTVNGDSSVQFTPLGGGTNFSEIDETGFNDGDTSYNFSTTVGHIDLFNVANLSTAPNAVFAVVLHTVAKIDVAGTINIRTRTNSGGTVTDSADRLLTTTYRQYLDFYGKDPNVAGAWTLTSVDALLTGYKYQS